MKLGDALIGMLGGKCSCPDCGSLMKAEEGCGECGYGTGGMGEEDDSEEETLTLQELLDVKDDLQRVLEKVNRLIVKSGD